MRDDDLTKLGFVRADDGTLLASLPWMTNGESR
jgi:hypothetical protein